MTYRPRLLAVVYCQLALVASLAASEWSQQHAVGGGASPNTGESAAVARTLDALAAAVQAPLVQATVVQAHAAPAPVAGTAAAPTWGLASPADAAPAPLPALAASPIAAPAPAQGLSSQASLNSERYWSTAAHASTIGTTAQPQEPAALVGFHAPSATPGSANPLRRPQPNLSWRWGANPLRPAR